jgi:hypothetical protein
VLEAAYVVVIIKNKPYWSSEAQTPCDFVVFCKMQVRHIVCKQKGSICRKLWNLNKMILIRFTMEGLVLPVLLPLSETARKG